MTNRDRSSIINDNIVSLHLLAQGKSNELAQLITCAAVCRKCEIHPPSTEVHFTAEQSYPCMRTYRRHAYCTAHKMCAEELFDVRLLFVIFDLFV